MQLSEETKFDKLQSSFFDEAALDKLTPKDIEIRRRCQSAFVVWIDNPQYSDKELVRFLRDEFNISRTQAYDDIQKVKIILGNVRNAGKEWMRHTVTEMLKEAYAIAKRANDAKSMVMAADKLGKYHKVDQNEAEQLPWDKLVPPQLLPTSDVSVLGITREKDFDKKVNQMKRKYLGSDLNVEEANVIE